MSDERATGGGRSRRARRGGALPGAAAVDRRGRAGDLRREGVLDLPARRGDRRARLRGGRGRGRGRSIGHAVPVRARASPAGCSSRGQPLVIEDLTKDPRFARRRAESTGYVPKGMMAVPLLDEERALGVLEVLDRPAAPRFTLARDGSARPVREPGGDRARPAADGPPSARRGRARRGAPRRWSPGSRRCCGARRTTRRRCACSRRSRPCSPTSASRQEGARTPTRRPRRLVEPIRGGGTQWGFKTFSGELTL